MNESFKPAWLKPLSGVDKPATYASISQKLAALCWSCRHPVIEADSHRRCRKCRVCKSLADIGND